MLYTHKTPIIEDLPMLQYIRYAELDFAFSGTVNFSSTGDAIQSRVLSS
jgi:hypothetical protein